MTDPFVFVVGVLVFARLGMRQPVPPAAIHLACAAWALSAVASPAMGWLEWAMSWVSTDGAYGTTPVIPRITRTVLAGFELLLVVAVVLGVQGAPTPPPEL